MKLNFVVERANVVPFNEMRVEDFVQRRICKSKSSQESSCTYVYCNKAHCLLDSADLQIIYADDAQSREVNDLFVQDIAAQGNYVFA